MKQSNVNPVPEDDESLPLIEVVEIDFINNPGGEPPAPSHEKADEILNQYPALFLAD